MTYTKIVEKYQLHLKLFKIPFRTDIDNTDWSVEASHYSFVITNGAPYSGNYGKKIRGYFSQGSAIKNKPTLIDILNSLSLDTMNIEEESFDLWCQDFGYDTDSRKAYKTYELCLDESKHLKELLGTTGVQELHECEQL